MDFVSERIEYLKKEIDSLRLKIDYYPSIIKKLNGRFIYANRLSNGKAQCDICPCAKLDYFTEKSEKWFYVCLANNEPLSLENDTSEPFRSDFCIKNAKNITDRDKKSLQRLESYEISGEFLRKSKRKLDKYNESLKSMQGELDYRIETLKSQENASVLKNP